MQTPKLSIVIPSHSPGMELVDFLDYAENTFTEFSEFIITISGGVIPNFLSEKISKWQGKSAIKLLHNQNADMVQNFNFGLQHAVGNYVAFIGDDDGVSSMIEKLTQWMLNHNINHVTPACIAFYWPQKNNSVSLILKASDFEFRQYIFLSEVSKTASRSGFPPHYFPKLYYGIASRKLLSELADSGATLFDYPSPDASSFLAIGNYVKDYIYVNSPIFIGGVSLKNNSGKITELPIDRFSKRIENIDFIKTLRVEANPYIPNYFSQSTAWPLVLAQLFEKLGIKQDINYLPCLMRMVISDGGVRLEAGGYILRMIFKDKTIINFLPSLFYVIRFYLSKHKNLLNISKNKQARYLYVSKISQLLYEVDNNYKNHFLNE